MGASTAWAGSLHTQEGSGDLGQLDRVQQETSGPGCTECGELDRADGRLGRRELDADGPEGCPRRQPDLRRGARDPCYQSLREHAIATTDLGAGNAELEQVTTPGFELERVACPDTSPNGTVAIMS